MCALLLATSFWGSILASGPVRSRRLRTEYRGQLRYVETDGAPHCFGTMGFWSPMAVERPLGRIFVLELWVSGRPWRSKGRLVEFFTVSAVVQSSPTVATTRTTETIHKNPTPRRPVYAAVYNFEPGQLTLTPDAFDTRGPQTLRCSQWVTSTIRQFDPAVYD